VGGSLQAAVHLYCEAPMFEMLSQLGDEFRFVTITSEAKVLPLAKADAQARDSELPGLKISVSATGHEKCVRCYHHREEIGSNPEHPELCDRCVENLGEEGEHRQFA